jgi:hypothetical protein
LNPGRRGGKPATNRFGYGAAVISTIVIVQKYFSTKACTAISTDDIIISIATLPFTVVTF